MTIEQDGTFRHGTSGFPVDVTLANPPIPPVVLTTLISLSMAVTRPDQTTYARSLAVPGCVIDALAGIIEFVVQVGDLTVPGIYRITFTPVFPAGPLPVDGTMKVT
jgi:hypothetical protein